MGLDLSAVELALVNHTRAGHVLELSSSSDREIRAEVIRALMQGRHPADLSVTVQSDPKGLQVNGAVVVGRIDLDYVRSALFLSLWNCEIQGGISAFDAHLLGLNLGGTQLGGSHLAEAALEGRNLDVERDLFVDSVEASSCSARGTVVLHGSHVGGQVSAVDSTFTNPLGPALNAELLQVDQSVFLDALQATGAGELGAVRLLGAHIQGQLSIRRNAIFSNPTGQALDGDLSRIDLGMFLQTLHASGAGESGAVRLVGASIGGSLEANNDVSIKNASGPGIAAGALHVERSLMIDGIDVTANSARGAVVLVGAEVGSQLSIGGATVTNPKGPAVNAESVQVGQSIYLDGLQATGAGDQGAVRLSSASVGGWVSAGVRCHLQQCIRAGS